MRADETRLAELPFEPDLADADAATDAA
jgi:hypothetical protein